MDRSFSFINKKGQMIIMMIKVFVQFFVVVKLQGHPTMQEKWKTKLFKVITAHIKVITAHIKVITAQ